MPSDPKIADNDNKQPETVAQQVLEAFYRKLAEKSKCKEIAERLKKESSNTEAAIRLALFGEGVK